MPKMKNSGVGWIGEIPYNWGIIKCKYISNFINGYSFNSGDLQTEFNYPVIRIGDIKDGGIDNINCLGVLSNTGLEKYKIIENDILLAMSGATVGKVGIANNIENSYINQRVGIIRSDFSRFLYYCLSTKEFIEYILVGANGSAQPNVSGEVFGKFVIPYPNFETQEKIISFLDKKCSEIDNLRSDIEKQISVLEDYKKSVITETVTKGLNPNVEMKDSGIEWIGKIPVHWNIVKTKYVNEISIGLVTTMTANYVDNPEDGVPLIRNGDIRTNKIEPNGMVYLSKKFVEKNANRKLKEKDIVTVHTGYIGTSAIIKDEYVGSVGFATIQSRPNLDKVNERYLCWFYNSNGFIEQCMFYNTGDGRQNLNLYDFVDLWIALPNLEEQILIANHIDEKCKDIDMSISDKKAQLKTLEEYKKSLIYEYVTGKKGVPNNE